jgi:hypothetical protein
MVRRVSSYKFTDSNAVCYVLVRLWNANVILDLLCN